MSIESAERAAPQPWLYRSVGWLSLAGGIAGIALGTVATARGAVDADGHGAGGLLAVMMLLTAVVGLACGLLYQRGFKPVLMAFGLIIAAALHIASGPVLGMVSGLLLLFAGMSAMMHAESERNSHGAR